MKRGVTTVSAIIVVVIIIGSIFVINLIGSLSGFQDISGDVTRVSVVGGFCGNKLIRTFFSNTRTNTYTCPSGSSCVNSKCQNKIIPTSTRCTDSDGGKNYNVRGTGEGFYSSSKDKGVIFGEDSNKVSIRYNNNLLNSIYYDHCFDSSTSNQLNEAYCDKNGLLQSYGYNCPNGCKDGACVTSPTITPTTSCNKKIFSMAFIVLARENSEITPEIINFLNNAKINFSEAFSIATNNLAYMDNSYQIVTIIDDGSLLSGSNPYYDRVMKEFYKNNPDKFDFVTIYPTFDIGYPAIGESHFIIKNDIKGIGLKFIGINGSNNTVSQTWDWSKNYGSNGKLIGINAGQQDINRVISYPENLQRGLLHETGHQWCCYIGDNFAENKSLKLEIKMQNMHFYRGLQSPYETGDPMGSDNWVPNGDGTYRRANKDGMKKYHPVVLYFMGLLPKSEYAKKYMLYDAGIVGVNFNDQNAIYYKQVNIDDIIKAEGNRVCL